MTNLRQVKVVPNKTIKITSIAAAVLLSMSHGEHRGARVHLSAFCPFIFTRNNNMKYLYSFLNGLLKNRTQNRRLTQNLRHFNRQLNHTVQPIYHCNFNTQSSVHKCISRFPPYFPLSWVFWHNMSTRGRFSFLKLTMPVHALSSLTLKGSLCRISGNRLAETEYSIH